jgi:ketosteroid isomerase-like protein
MSERNVDVVRRWIGFYNQRDTDGLMELTSPDYEMKSVFADVESGGIFRGHAGFPFAYFESIDEVYDQFELVTTELIDVGAAVLMEGSMRWRGKESGIDGESPLWAVFWLRAGKVFREESFTEEAEAREAVGLTDN